MLLILFTVILENISKKNKLSFLLNKYQINREYGQDESGKSKNNNN